MRSFSISFALIVCCASAALAAPPVQHNKLQRLPKSKLAQAFEKKFPKDLSLNDSVKKAPVQGASIRKAWDKHYQRKNERLLREQRRGELGELLYQAHEQLTDKVTNDALLAEQERIALLQLLKVEKRKMIEKTVQEMLSGNEQHHIMAEVLADIGPDLKPSPHRLGAVAKLRGDREALRKRIAASIHAEQAK